MVLQQMFTCPSNIVEVCNAFDTICGVSTAPADKTCRGCQALGSGSKGHFSETTTSYLRCLFGSSFPRSLQGRNTCAPLPNLPSTCPYCTDWDRMLRVQWLIVFVGAERRHGEDNNTRWDRRTREFPPVSRSKRSRQVTAEQLL